MTQQVKLQSQLEGDRTLVMKRSFRAPRELLFKCYASCEHLMNWWGPREYPLSVCNQDFRPGGKWHYCMRGPNGEEAWGIAVYREIVEPERIVYLDAFSNAEGDVVPPESTVTVFFESAGDDTILNMRIEFASAADRDTVIGMGVEEGMGSSLDRLDEHLESLQS